MVKQVIEEVCSERERMVLDLNYLPQQLNFQEIASLDGMSRERIGRCTRKHCVKCVVLCETETV